MCLMAVACTFLGLCVYLAHAYTAWAISGQVLFAMYISIPIIDAYSHDSSISSPSLSGPNGSNPDGVEFGLQSFIPEAIRTFSIRPG